MTTVFLYLISDSIIINDLKGPENDNNRNTHACENAVNEWMHVSARGTKKSNQVSNDGPAVNSVANNDIPNPVSEPNKPVLLGKSQLPTNTN